VAERAGEPGAADRVQRWVRPQVRAARGYQADTASRSIRLNAMENPYPLPAELHRDWLHSLRACQVNRYPAAEAGELRDALRRVLEVPASCSILPGNGSDELILYLSMALAAPGHKALAPEPTFSIYRHVAECIGMEFIGVPLRADDFALDLDAMLAAINRHRPAVVWLAWPNNPTGRLYDEADLHAIVRAAPGVVVIDEAYQPYSRRSMLPAVGDYPHLLVLRTLSKLGLAGLRVGALIGAEPWLREIDKLRLPYNLGTLNQHSATFLLNRIEALHRQLARITAARDALHDELATLPGLTVWRSHANFLLLRLPAHSDANATDAALQQRDVLIRNLHGSHPLLHNCLRVSIGTPEENHHFLTHLRALL